MKLPRMGKANAAFALSALSVMGMLGIAYPALATNSPPAKEVRGDFPIHVHKVGTDVVILIQDPFHGNGNRDGKQTPGTPSDKNGLGHRDNEIFSVMLHDPQADPSQGWKACANRIHLLSILSGYNATPHFIQYQEDNRDTPGLWIAHSFDDPMDQQRVWLHNANPDSAGDRGDVQWIYRKVTGYFKPPASGSPNATVIMCKKEATKAALSQVRGPWPGEVIGPAGDDNDPVIH